MRLDSAAPAAMMGAALCFLRLAGARGLVDREAYLHAQLLAGVEREHGLRLIVARGESLLRHDRPRLGVALPRGDGAAVLGVEDEAGLVRALERYTLHRQLAEPGVLHNEGDGVGLLVADRLMTEVNVTDDGEDIALLSGVARARAVHDRDRLYDGAAVNIEGLGVFLALFGGSAAVERVVYIRAVGGDDDTSCEAYGGRYRRSSDI